MKVLVIGAGKMTTALLKGLAALEDLSSWGIYSPSGRSNKELAQAVGAMAVDKLEDVTVTPEWILLGCKPQQLPDFARILPARFRDCPFVSMLAAIPEQDQRRILGVDQLVRIMPNLPVASREGVTLICSESARKLVPEYQQLLAQVGMALVVTEPELEELTLLTGSGPALFYEFALNLAGGFSSLSAAQRELLALQVMYGAALSAHQEKLPLQTKIDAVTSQGGVTIAVLEAWRANALVKLIGKGVSAGLDRGRALKAALQASR
jgi:pyrroline-5-carboxylate reductase